MKREPETFAERLKRLREAAGLTQVQLAEKAGLSQPALSYLEAGDDRPGRVANRPKADTLAALATALGDGSLAIWDGVEW